MPGYRVKSPHCTNSVAFLAFGHPGRTEPTLRHKSISEYGVRCLVLDLITESHSGRFEQPWHRTDHLHGRYVGRMETAGWATAAVAALGGCVLVLGYVLDQVPALAPRNPYGLSPRYVGCATSGGTNERARAQGGALHPRPEVKLRCCARLRRGRRGPPPHTGRGCRGARMRCSPRWSSRSPSAARPGRCAG